jgi:hypothetical protein
MEATASGAANILNKPVNVIVLSFVVHWLAAYRGGSKLLTIGVHP